MGGDILLVDSHRMGPSPLRGHWEKEWKEQELWNKTFRVPVSEQFEVHGDGSITWLTTGTHCPAGSWFFNAGGHADLLEDVFLRP